MMRIYFASGEGKMQGERERELLGEDFNWRIWKYSFLWWQLRFLIYNVKNIVTLIRQNNLTYKLVAIIKL